MHYAFETRHEDPTDPGRKVARLLYTTNLNVLMSLAEDDFAMAKIKMYLV